MTDKSGDERRSDGDGMDSSIGDWTILKKELENGDDGRLAVARPLANVLVGSVHSHQVHHRQQKKKQQQQQHLGRIRATVLVSTATEPSPDDPSGRPRAVVAVPHEPYKAAVHAVCHRSHSSEITGADSGQHQFAIPTAFTNAFCRGGNGSGSASERIVGFREVPSAERLWTAERERLEAEVERLRQDQTCLAAQLQMQTQVNGELKRLLVASVGEDMETRVHFLTEDKTRLAHSLLHYSQKQTEDVEHLERLTIQCDVWRSKFLATSLMVDELAGWKALLGYRLDEAIEAIRVLLAEFDQVHRHCHDAVGNLSHLHQHMSVPDGGVSSLPPSIEESEDRGASARNVLQDATSVEEFTDRLCRELSRGEEPRKRSTGVCPRTNEFLTRGQRLAHQVLSNSHNFDLLPSAGHSDHRRGASATSSSPRFHPNARYEHLTFNCCGHCRGDIKLL